MKKKNKRKALKEVVGDFDMYSVCGRNTFSAYLCWLSFAVLWPTLLSPETLRYFELCRATLGYFIHCPTLVYGTFPALNFCWALVD